MKYSPGDAFYFRWFLWIDSVFCFCMLFSCFFKILFSKISMKLQCKNKYPIYSLLKGSTQAWLLMFDSANLKLVRLHLSTLRVVLIPSTSATHLCNWFFWHSASNRYFHKMYVRYYMDVIYLCYRSQHSLFQKCTHRKSFLYKRLQYNGQLALKCPDWKDLMDVFSSDELFSAFTLF